MEHMIRRRYQVAQSLFAIGTAAVVRSGTLSGQPDTIPVSRQRTSSFLHTPSEEMGLILCDVSDTDCGELLCDVLKYRNAAA